MTKTIYKAKQFIWALSMAILAGSTKQAGRYVNAAGAECLGSWGIQGMIFDLGWAFEISTQNQHSNVGASKGHSYSKYHKWSAVSSLVKYLLWLNQKPTELSSLTGQWSLWRILFPLESPGITCRHNHSQLHAHETSILIHLDIYSPLLFSV